MCSMNDYSLEKLRKDPVFWVLLYLSLPTIVGIAVGVGDAVIHQTAFDAEFGVADLLSTPLAIYLGLGRQIPRAQAIKAASAQEQTLIDNGHIKFEDDMDEGLKRILEDEGE